MTKKLIIFDCDGVLIDSEFISSKIFSETLSSFGYSISTEESIRRFTGVSVKDAREIIHQESAINIPENYWGLQEQTLTDAFEKELAPLIQPVLEFLQKFKINRCVASNSTKKHISHCFGLTNLSSYFSHSSIFTAEQVARAKPAPDLFLHAAKEMGFMPENCLVIEDSLVGIKAAKAAGMQVLPFLGGTHARYDWYRSKIDSDEIPVAKDCKELEQAIAQFISSH